MVEQDRNHQGIEPGRNRSLPNGRYLPVNLVYNLPVYVRLALYKNEDILIVSVESGYPEKAVALMQPQFLVDDVIRHAFNGPVRQQLGELLWKAVSYQLGSLDECPEKPVMRVCRFCSHHS